MVPNPLGCLLQDTEATYRWKNADVVFMSRDSVDLLVLV